LQFEFQKNLHTSSLSEPGKAFKAPNNKRKPPRDLEEIKTYEGKDYPPGVVSNKRRKDCQEFPILSQKNLDILLENNLVDEFDYNSSY
jgi:hypothetical protein